MTITEFLLARIAEDEKPALDLWGGGGKWWAKNADRVMAADLLPAEHEMSVQWNPARVLAECEAKRRQIDHLIEFMEGDYAPWNEDQLFMMASVYADHPDFDEAWLPI